MALTNLKIRSAVIGNKLHDGSGLYLTLSARGRGKWTMRYMMNRKAKEIGLGPYPEISLCRFHKNKHLCHTKITIRMKSRQNQPLLKEDSI